MIILEGGSRPEKQDEAPPLPASLPPQFFGAVLPRTLQKYPRCVPSFCLDLTPVKLSDPYRIRECLEDDGITVSDEQYQLDPLWLFNDNLGTTQTINRPESSSQRSKHIDLRYYCVRQYVRDMKIRVAYIGTDYNIADFFTKGLTYPKFSLFRKRIGLLSRR